METVSPKIGVVLSSGGLKPISSLALFDFLEEEGIEIDLCVGCSGGGIMAAFKGIGYDNQQIIDATNEFLKKKAFSNVNYQTLLSIANLPFGKFNLEKGLLKKEISLQTCEKLFGEYRLESLKFQTLLQTTDIQTGEGVILQKRFISRNGVCFCCDVSPAPSFVY